MHDYLRKMKGLSGVIMSTPPQKSCHCLSIDMIHMESNWRDRYGTRWPPDLSWICIRMDVDSAPTIHRMPSTMLKYLIFKNLVEACKRIRPPRKVSSDVQYAWRCRQVSGRRCPHGMGHSSSIFFYTSLTCHLSLLTSHLSHSVRVVVCRLSFVVCRLEPIFVHHSIPWD